MTTALNTGNIVFDRTGPPCRFASLHVPYSYLASSDPPVSPRPIITSLSNLAKRTATFTAYPCVGTWCRMPSPLGDFCFVYGCWSSFRLEMGMESIILPSACIATDQSDVHFSCEFFSLLMQQPCRHRNAGICSCERVLTLGLVHSSPLRYYITIPNALAS